MKEISFKIDEELHRRAARKVDENDAVLNARTHLAELFGATRNFGVGVRPSREGMHARRNMVN